MDVISENTPVEIRNVGTKRFVGAYANQTWIIEPGKKTLAPYLAACLWFGDPRSVNIGDAQARPELQYRTREIDRLSVKYGMAGDPWYADDVDLDRETFAEDNNDHYKRRRYVEGRHPGLPQCEVYDLDGGRLWTVIEDPLGQRDMEPVTTTAERDVTLESIAQLQAQVKQLQNQLLLKDPEAGAKSLRPSQPTAGESGVPDASGVKAAIGSETRDPTADPEDPSAHASADLPPRERALAAKKQPVARKPPGAED